MPKSFPFFKQLDEMDCGACCLRMVTRFHNKEFSLAHLKELTNFNKEGVSLLDISEASEKLGMRSLAAKITYKQLLEDVPLPCISYWAEEHFVVIYDVTETDVTIGDPASNGITELPKAEFLKDWLIKDEDEGQEYKGIVLLLETTPDFFDTKETEEDSKGYKHLFQSLKRYKGLIFQLSIGLFFASLLQFFMPFLIRAVVDIGIGNQDLSFMWLIFGGMILLLISQILLEFIRGYLITHVGMHFNINLLTEFLIKLMRMPIRYFENHSIGDFLQRVNDNERLERFLSSSAFFSIFSILNIIFFSIVLLIFDWKVFLIFLVGSIIYVLWVRLYLNKRKSFDHKRFRQSAINHNYLLELIGGMQDIKLNNAERNRRWAWEKQQAKLFRLTVKSRNLELWQSRGAYFISELKNICIIIYAAYAVTQGDITLGMMLAIMYILGQLNTPINHLVEFAQNYQEANISYMRMNEIHTQEIDLPVSKITNIPALQHISIENLSFQYGGSHSKWVLNDIHLKIPAGKTTAIVGSSGSGKTTLLKLLLGIYSPTQGHINVGPNDLQAIDEGLWRDKTAAVMHDGFVFSDTIAQNIALSDSVLNVEKLNEAIRLADLQKFIEHQPNQLNTRLGETGIQLSNGIKQRLLVARAIYKDSDYLFLDEATNALDVYKEMILMENLRDHFKDKTIVMVAHRLNTVKYADQIIVMEEGEIIEKGTHKTLKQQGGAYAHLVRRSLELGE